MGNSERVLLVGLDGLGREEIDDWIDDGSLAVLNAFQQSGTLADLESTHPPWTPCAWPSFLTGRNPGKHGVFDFFTSDGYEKRLIERSDVKSPYLFEVADAAGLTSLVINYPVTHPASELEHGAVVPGYLAREDVECQPSHLRAEYENEYGPYRIYPEYGTKDGAVDEYVAVAQCRRDMARFLDGRYEWDLLAVQFQVTDSIFHDLDDRDEIRRVLTRVDGFVSDLIDLAGDDTTVIIASDHGMGDYDWTFYVNSWLADHGYCQTTRGETQYFRDSKESLKTSEKQDASSDTATALMGQLVGVLSAFNVSPARIHAGLSKVGLADAVERLLPEEALVAAQNQVVDHPASAAFQLYFNSLGVNINVEGRDAAGVVPQDEYDEFRATLIEQLEAVRDPDGELVFDDVRPREDVYWGEQLTAAPDVLLFPREYRYDVSGSILNTFRRFEHKNHKPEGILLSNRALDVSSPASIYDVAPTVAAALGLPVDSSTDGEILGDYSADRREEWDEIAGDYVTQATTDDTSSVEDRLADLGYME